MRSLQILLLAGTASAHFTMSYPGTRGSKDEELDSYPCGGFNDASAERVSFPLSGGPIQIDNSHTKSLLQVNLAVGDGSFDHVVVPTVLQEGPGEFCFGNVSVAGLQGLNLTEGSNGTLQVITGGSHGGLYACVDVTFTSTPLSSEDYSSHCKNASGSSVAQLQDSKIKANETTDLNLPTVAAGSSPSDAAYPSSTGAAAPAATMMSWALGAVGVVGGLMAI